MQSTGEKPVGPMTLRVFPGDNCQGTLYHDDGQSYDFCNGAYLRQHFPCSRAADGSITVDLAAQEGRYSAWWTTMRIENVSPGPSVPTATIFGKTTQSSTCP